MSENVSWERLFALMSALSWVTARPWVVILRVVSQCIIWNWLSRYTRYFMTKLSPKFLVNSDGVETRVLSRDVSERGSSCLLAQSHWESLYVWLRAKTLPCHCLSTLLSTWNISSYSVRADCCLFAGIDHVFCRVTWWWPSVITYTCIWCDTV